MPAPVCARGSQAGPAASDTLAKVASAFLKFLEDASLFYKRLAMQLQVRSPQRQAGQAQPCPAVALERKRQQRALTVRMAPVSCCRVRCCGAARACSRRMAT
jgi:hypothetical protein